MQPFICNINSDAPPPNSRVLSPESWMDLISQSPLSDRDQVLFLTLLRTHPEWLNSTNLLQETALVLASKHNFTEIVRALIDAGADLNVQDAYGCTALITSISLNHFHVYRDLIDAGADVNIPDRTGWTPLMFAAYLGDLPLMHQLLQSDADVNAQNQEGWTPLMFASKENKLEAVRILLDHGANPLLQNKDQQTALNVSEIFTKDSIFLYLKAYFSHQHLHQTMQHPSNLVSKQKHIRL